MSFPGFSLVLFMASLAFEIESESVFRRYEVQGLSQESILFSPFSESLRMSVTQPIRRGHISFDTYFRGIGQPSEEGSELTPKLYLAHADLVKGRRHPVALRVGRQISAFGNEFFSFDGLRIRYRTPHFVGFEAYGGTRVQPSAFEEPAPLTEMVLGSSIFLVGFSKTQASLGLKHVQNGADILHQNVHLSLFQRFHRRLRVYGNVNLNTLIVGIDEGLVGSSLDLTLRGMVVDFEGYQFRPSFDSTSIFNVFQSASYHEGRMRLRIPLSGGRSWLYGRGGIQFFDDEPGFESTAVAAGAGGRFNLRYSYLGIRSMVTTGFGGLRVGVNLESGVRFWGDRFTVLMGAQAMHAQNSSLSPNPGLFSSLYTAARMKIIRQVDMGVQVEEEFSNVVGNQFRATANLMIRWSTTDTTSSKVRPLVGEVRP